MTRERMPTLDLHLDEVAQGFLSVSGHLLELYRLKRNGNFAEQQKLVSALQRQERDQAASIAVEMELLQSHNRVLEGEAFRQMDLRADVGRADLDLQKQRLARRLQREDERALFRNNDADAFRKLAEEVTNNRTRPVLLIAPFHRDDLTSEENQESTPLFRFGLRRRWMTAPWSHDLGCLDGAIARPLSDTDADILTIREVLDDLPVVLIHGEIQAQERVWASVVAWNIADTDNGPWVYLNLSPRKMPPDDQEAPSRLAFEDELGDVLSAGAELFAEWFHVLQQNRVPRFHEYLRECDPALAGVGAAYGIAYDVAIARGQLSEAKGRIQQADLYASAGLMDHAAEAARVALALVTSEPETVTVTELRRLRGVLQTLNDPLSVAQINKVVQRKIPHVIRNFR